MPTPKILASLKIQSPDTIRYGKATVRVGPAVWRAMSAIRKAGGSLPVDDLCRRVWGRDVPRVRVRILCHRVSRKLLTVGYPGRCGVDGSTVLLC
jgi:hypothetical protein